MRLDLPLTAIVPQMAEAKILRLLAQQGDALGIGAALLEIEVDLSSQVTHDCPPISYFRIVLREKAHLRRWDVSPGDTLPVGQLLAVLSQTSDETLDGEAARRVRTNAAGIFPQWDEMG